MSRITRSAYGDPVYVRLMGIAHGEAWPALEADLGRTLVHRRDGLFFGPARGRLWSAYASAVASVGVDVERIDVPEARRRFPAFGFPGDDLGILHDHTSGVVAARDTVTGLAAWLREHVDVREETEVLAVDAQGADTTRGRIDADRVIVTAGPWTGRLVPRLRAALAPARQTVVYLDAEVDADRFPVWVGMWDGPNELYYGLPPFGRPGLKIARHFTSEHRDDPDADPGEPDPSHALAFAREHLAAPVRGLIATERCFYTNTDDEDFVLDEVDGIVVGSACSGHGFKFGPLTGRILAELALDGRSSVTPFQAERARFGAESAGSGA
jgi:sarcosine oxidase